MWLMLLITASSGFTRSDVCVSPGRRPADALANHPLRFVKVCQWAVHRGDLSEKSRGIRKHPHWQVAAAKHGYKNGCPIFCLSFLIPQSLFSSFTLPVFASHLDECLCLPQFFSIISLFIYLIAFRVVFVSLCGLNVLYGRFHSPCSS